MIKKINRQCFILTVFFLLITGFFSGSLRAEAQSDSVLPADPALQKILGEKDPFKRLSLLEKHLRISLSAENSREFDKNIYLHLVDTSYQTMDFSRVIRYGRKALTREWNNAQLKLALYFYMARSYEELQVNLEKAMHYCDFAVSLAAVEDPEQKNTAMLQKFVIPLYKVKFRILTRGFGDIEYWREGLRLGEWIVGTWPDREFGAKFYDTCVRLHDYGDLQKQAVLGVEKLCADQSLCRPEYLNRLALWYSKAQKTDRAVSALARSYSMRLDGGVAYTLGKLLQNSNLDRAMDYLAQAVALNTGESVKKAKKLLQHLFFNIRHPKMPPQKQETAFRKLLEHAEETVKKQREQLRSSD